MKSEDLVGRIHFFEVVAEQDAAREIRSGDTLTGVSEREQVMRC